MKIRVYDFDLRGAKRFDSFSSVIFNCKMKYCCFHKNLNNTQVFKGFKAGFKQNETWFLNFFKITLSAPKLNKTGFLTVLKQV